MIVIDWAAFGLGGIAGALVGALFFIGLALGMRAALRSARPTPVLLLSSALRLAGLLVVAWLIVQRSPTALFGFALAFVAVRVAAIAIARRPQPKEGARCH